MNYSEIPVVIFAGGLGTRLREETEFRPKPMVPIGGKPIIWHIMKYYSHYGFRKFIVCLGYKGELIKDYFLKYPIQSSDFSINTKTGVIKEFEKSTEDWDVTLVDTGQNAQTGSRLARIASYIKNDLFMLTYGDGLANINIKNLLDFHISHGKQMTLTGVLMPLRFGHLGLEENKVIEFREKERISQEWVNGGFFVCNKEVLTKCRVADDCIFEREVVEFFCKTDQLMAYKHDGFWYCMDTIRDKEHLESLWMGQAPWRVWELPQKDFFLPSRKIQESVN